MTITHCLGTFLLGSAVAVANLGTLARSADFNCQNDGQKQEEGAAAENKPLDREKLEKEFEKTMSGATLIGSFTVNGNKDTKLTQDKYTISRVKKLKGDRWQFETRIQYGDHDLTVPLALEVKWAGDTAVITVTDLPVPGLGTFTARVLVFRNEYAGTWTGGDHGGQMFGRIVKKGESSDEKSAAKSADTK